LLAQARGAGLVTASQAAGQVGTKPLSFLNRFSSLSMERQSSTIQSVPVPPSIFSRIVERIEEKLISIIAIIGIIVT
jgi:hypothetical protein